MSFKKQPIDKDFDRLMDLIRLSTGKKKHQYKKDPKWFRKLVKKIRP